MEENFLLDLVSCIEQSKSQKQINNDIKTLEKTINMLRLTATLAQGSSKKEINAYIKQLSGQLSTIKLKAQIDSKNIKADISKALNNVSFKDIDILNIDENKSKLKLQKVFADAKSFAEKNPISIGVNIDSKRSKLDNDLTTYLNKNTKINESSVLLAESNKVRDLISAITDKKSLREATDAFQLYKSTVAAVGYNTESTSDKIKGLLSRVTKLGSIFSVTTLAMNNFTKSLKTLQNIDDILTEISKTSNLTVQELEKLGNASFKSASKYGKTASDYLTGIQEMSRSGFYGEKGTAMAEQSLLAQAAGDISADVANKYILATNAAYKYNGEVSKLNAVLNGQNSITNRNSVSMEDMATAMSKAGTVASSYRVSVEDLSAMIGTMESVTKLDGSEIGNGIKAILINLQNITSSKITDTLDAANASMTEFVNGTEKLRDPISILRDLAETFNQLDEDDALRAEILTNIGGKHQASKLAALLQNMELFDKMLVDYSEGAGSAMEEAMKSANNWSGKLNQLQNSWDSLVNSVVSKDAVLGGLTFGDKMIQGIEGLIEKFGVIPTILTAVNSSIVTLNKDYGLTKIWDKETKKIDFEGNIFGIDISKIKNLKKHYEDAAIAISDWNCELINGKTDLDAFDNACVKNSASLKEYLSTCSKDAPASLNEYRDYLQKTGQAAEDLRLKTVLLNTALTFLGGIAVQAIITGLVQAFDKFNDTVVESKQRLDDANSKISDLKSQIEELNSLEYKSEFDNQKISQLERELELQEKILEVEQKRLYQNQIGTKFSDYFDEDSLVTKRESELDRRNKEGYTYLSLKFKADKSSIEDIESEIESLQDQLDNGLLNGLEDEAEMRINQLIEKRNDLLKKQQTIEDQLTVNAGKYFENYETAKEAVESGLLTGKDLEKAESMAEYWNSLYQDSVNIVTNIQKMRGTYDNTNDLLEEKFGNISRDDLVSLSDDDKRIALSFDPDNTIGFEELKRKIEETKGDIEELNATEVKTFDQAWADSFTSENDAVKGLGDSLLELAEQGRLTIETFNEADSTDYFKNFNISADEAVSKINKLVDESKQLSSMSSQISSMADALGTKQENGFVEADTLAGFDAEVRGLESWDRFQEVLGSTTSSYEECQEAANALATEWVNSSDFLAQLTEQNREYYATQLEAMGIENYEEVISYAMALNDAKEVLSQSSLMLGEATQDEIEALIAEGTYSELTANMILALYDAKIAEQAATLDTSADCANLIALAGDTDRTSKSIELLIQLMNIYNGLESGVYDNNEFARTGALAVVTGIKAQLEAIANGETAKMEIEPTVKLGNRGKSSAKSAGKEAGKSYKDGLKEELSDLEGILSSLSKAIDGQKEIISSQKEAALESIESQISALEEERDARLAVIDAQKKQLEEQIKAIDKKIDAKQKEIKAINDAAKAREHELQLQKSLYELERMQNQRTILQYSEDKGMHYVADLSKISSAREDVDAAKRQLDIDAIEREIDLLEESKDLLNEKIDLLDEQVDSINKFYDSQIKSLEKQKESTEKYFESLIKSIENSKSKYQELLDIVDKAELSGKLKKLGIDEEALLNGSEEEFEKLKNAYLDVVFQVNEGNEEMLSSLRELSGYEGTAPAMLADTTEKLDEVNEQLDSSTQSMDKFSDSATAAGEGTSAVAENMSELGTSTEGISDNLTSINDALNGLPEAENINAVSDAFTSMGEAIKSVADALGVGEEGTVGGLVGALQSLSEISLGEMGDNGQGGGSGIVSQFQALKTAVDDVTYAISGGGTSGSSGGGDASGSSSPSMSAGAGGEGASGLVGAIESFKSATDEALGSGGEEGEGSEGEGSGAIGQFGQLKTAVDEVSDAIGKGDSEGDNGGSGGEEDAANLIGAITNLGETTEEILAGGGESDGKSGGVIGRFEEFKDVIGEANEHVTGISEGLAAIDGQEVECTIKVNIETTGGLPAGLAHSTGTALDTMKLESADYNAKYLGKAHVEGTALASGNWAVQSDEQSALVGEEGFEIIVRNGRFFTVGNNGAEMTNIKKGDIVFNHEQSVNLLKNGHISGRGKAYADGTVGGGKILADNGEILRPLQPGDKMYDMVQKFDAYFKSINGNIEKLVPNSYYEHNRQIDQMVNRITNISNISNNNKPSVVLGDIHVTCPGVTSQQVAEQLGGVIGKELDKQFSGFHNYVDQQSRIR